MRFVQRGFLLVAIGVITLTGAARSSNAQSSGEQAPAPPSVASAPLDAIVSGPSGNKVTTARVDNSRPGKIEASLSGTNGTCRAFIKGSTLRLYLIEGARYHIFKVSWDHSRAPAQTFSYTTAKLEPRDSGTGEPRWPHAGEVKILSKADSECLIRTAAEQLVPSQAGHGIHCRYALGDAVLFRDPAGQVLLRRVEETAAELVIERRYNRQELASAAAMALETRLRLDYPGQAGFLLALGSGSQFRFVFVDLAERKVAMLYVPCQGDDAYEPTPLGFRISNLASIALVDHVWTFLKNPVSSCGRTVSQWLEWPLTLIGPRLRPNRGALPALSQAAGMDLVSWEEWLDRHTDSPRERGSVRLLIDGDRFFPLLERRVAEAQSNICIHVCIFDNDDLGVELADALKQRSTNIEIKVVFDRMISRGAARAMPATPMRAGFTPPHSMGDYLRSGSKVRVRPQPNPGLSADHSKIFLIDQRYVYIGGMNLGREYRYEWHDLMAEVQGPVVASFQRQFDKKWAQVGLWGDCGLAKECLRKRTSSSEPPEPGLRLIELRRLYTRSFDHQIRRAERAAIDRARSRIFVENPYFFSNEMLTALTRARQRGVDVRVIMPSENDVNPGHKSNLRVANYLLDHHVRVYFYPGMTHVKALLVDGWTCFGSANFDNLSLRLLREADLASSDPELVNEIRTELFEADLARSRELKTPVATDWSDYVADALLTPF